MTILMNPLRLGLFAAMTLLAAASAQADLAGDLAFTAFPNPDLNALAGGQILQARGGLIAFQRGITAQSLYMIDATPAAVQDKLAHWNPDRHSELMVWMHRTLPANPSVADFSVLNGLPDNRSINNMVNAVYAYTPGSSSVQLNAAEAQVVYAGHGQPPSKAFIVDTWSRILAGRMKDFLSGNTSAAVYAMGDDSIHPLDEIHSLLQSDPKVERDFHNVIAGTPIEGATRVAPTDLYLECFDIEDTAAFATGALFQSVSPRTIQQADVEFYVSSGIYTSVELEQLWPVTINGRTETLVWRDDLVSTYNVAYLHGVERLASGMLMLQDVKQAIQAFRSEFK
jgi:hypothetical protein